MKKLLTCLQSTELLCVYGMTTEFGYTTERKRLTELKHCEDWLRNNPKNSIRIYFTDDTQRNFY